MHFLLKYNTPQNFLFQSLFVHTYFKYGILYIILDITDINLDIPNIKFGI